MTILLPVDGTDTALEAVRHALRLRSEGLQCRFVLANVQATPTLYEIVTAQDPQVIDDVRRAAALDLIAAAAALLDAAGADYATEIAAGEPANLLVEIAERNGCDAVVIGAERHGGLRSVLIGSVSQSLIHDCPVPVTVVHRRDEGEAARTGEDADEGDERRDAADDDADG